MTWLISWRGDVWSEDDLTGAHLAVITNLLGKETWNVLPTTGPVTLMAVLVAFIALAEQRPVTQVMAEVNAASATEIIEALTIE